MREIDNLKSLNKKLNMKIKSKKNYFYLKKGENFKFLIICVGYNFLNQSDGIINFFLFLF